MKKDKTTTPPIKEASTSREADKDLQKALDWWRKKSLAEQYHTCMKYFDQKRNGSRLSEQEIQTIYEKETGQPVDAPKHTPGTAAIIGEDFGKCRIGILDSDRQQRLCSMYADFSQEESKANAERIVKAWNEYDLLKEANIKLVGEIAEQREFHNNWLIRTDEFVKELRAENDTLKAALQNILDLKYEPGMSRPYVNGMLEIARKALLSSTKEGS